MTRELQPCGTNAAYARHTKAGEDPCDACKEAHNAYNQAWAAGTLPEPPLPPCGTVKAYDRHRYRREPIDDLCRQVHSDYMRDWRAKRKQAKAERAAFDAMLAEAWAETASAA